MRNRYIIIALTCIFYPLQFALVMYWFSVSAQGTSPVDIPMGFAVNIVFAAVNVGIVRYILHALDNTREGYVQSVNNLLDQYLEAYRAEAEQEERLIHSLMQEIDEELAHAAEALSTGKSDEMGRHLRSSLALASQTHVPLCDHTTVAAVLESKARQCDEAQVTLATNVVLPEEMTLPDIEVASIFFNLIDNALNECVALLADDPLERPTVNVYACIRAGQLFVKVGNPCRPASVTCHQEAAHQLGKDSLHGWGTGIVKEIAAKYGGLYQFGETDGTFTASVMIPLVEQQNDTTSHDTFGLQ